ncbi:MAG: hypothetical protein AAGD01_04955 [Acidobacteriota bacterium]
MESKPSPSAAPLSRLVPRLAAAATAVVIASGGLLLGPAPEADARGVEVRLKLPQKARLDLKDKETVTVLPFLVVGGEAERSRRARSIDIQAEFDRYFNKVMRRETQLKVLEPGPVDYPTFDVDQLARERDFWSYIGERTQADLVVSGSLDFDIQDRTGYRTEPYVSPFNGQTYYRQVLVEETGFEYDIVMQVYDGTTGELLYRDNFKDFQNYEGNEADPLQGMFENLFSLEDRILGLFTQKEIEASRVLFTS